MRDIKPLDDILKHEHDNLTVTAGKINSYRQQLVNAKDLFQFNKITEEQYNRMIDSIVEQVSYELGIIL